jgi:hypothetical protein
MWGRFFAYDERGFLVGEVADAEEGWSGQTARTFLGIYLTIEMAQGAVGGVHHIETYGGYYTPPAKPRPRALKVG